MAKRKRAYNRRSPEQQIKDLEAQIAVLKRELRERKKFSPEAVREDRARLELSAADYADLVGVSPLTIYSWEHGRSKPRSGQLMRWLEIRGMPRKKALDTLGIEDLANRGGFSPEAVFAERERLELSAADYGELVGVSMLTIYNWEKGKSFPREALLEKWLQVKGIGKREAWKRLGLE
ncbi:MAG: helix-turn-helix domain-containing protein [Planctomycetota bacterium]